MGATEVIQRAALDVLASADCHCEPENECWWDCVESARSRQADNASAVIDAVRPLIEADLRERLAAAIDREWAEAQNRDRYDGGYRDGYLDGLERAEHVVRERP